MPATSGCRWMTTTAWSTTGCTRTTDAPLTEEDRRERGIGNGPDFVDQTTFRSFQNRSNNYGLDREVQRTESYTGIDGINQQDRALQESMGPIVDRSKEHLGPADKAIGQTRRMLRAGGQDGAGGRRPGRHRHQLLPHPGRRGGIAARCRLARRSWRPTSPRRRSCRRCEAQKRTFEADFTKLDREQSASWPGLARP